MCYVHIYRIISLTKCVHYSTVQRSDFPTLFLAFSFPQSLMIDDGGGAITHPVRCQWSSCFSGARHVMRNTDANKGTR